MKRHEIKKCVICGKGVMHNGQILFYKIEISRMAVDLGAVQRLQGLEMMLNPALASVMGPDEDIAMPIGGPDKALICDACAMKSTCLAALHERIAE